MFRIDPATLDFTLPDELIAQEPAKVRDQARLLVLHRATGKIEHKTFVDLEQYLKPDDVLVLNKAKVSKSKLLGHKSSGGKIEVIFLERLNGGAWKALLRPTVKAGTLFNAGGLTLTAKERFETGEYALEVKAGNVEHALTSGGRLPLPPYIKRNPDDPRVKMDEREYQTIYAQQEGSVAAPTAGLHFSERLLSALKSKGVNVVEILLHVGWGTFKPIVDTVATHQMLSEKYEVSAAAMKTLKAAKKAGHRVIAVGTTSTRTLESLPLPDGERAGVRGKTPTAGETKLFIQPGYKFKYVDALITNLHVPRSTPVSLTAAFAGLENLERAYAAAIQEKYRFYSYGDAMLVL